MRGEEIHILHSSLGLSLTPSIISPLNFPVSNISRLLAHLCGLAGEPGTSQARAYPFFASILHVLAYMYFSILCTPHVPTCISTFHVLTGSSVSYIHVQTCSHFSVADIFIGGYNVYSDSIGNKIESFTQWKHMAMFSNGKEALDIHVALHYVHI